MEVYVFSFYVIQTITTLVRVCDLYFFDLEFLETLLNVGARLGVDKKWGIGEPKQ